MKAIAVVPGTKIVQLVDRPEPSISEPEEIKVACYGLASVAPTAPRPQVVAPRHPLPTKIWCWAMRCSAK
jgi:hypothetical protein